MIMIFVAFLKAPCKTNIFNSLYLSFPPFSPPPHPGKNLLEERPESPAERGAKVKPRPTAGYNTVERCIALYYMYQKYVKYDQNDESHTNMAYLLQTSTRGITI
jgi:hypothetical protein